MQGVSSNRSDIHIMQRCVFVSWNSYDAGKWESSDIGYWFTEFPYMTASARYCFSVVSLKIVLTNLCFCRWMCVRVVIIIVTNTGFTYKLNSKIHFTFDALATQVAEMYILDVIMPACCKSRTTERSGMRYVIGEFN